MHRHGFTLRDGKAALSPARSQSTALRILPVVIVALVALLSFKTIGLVRDGGYAFPFGASGSEHPFDNFGRLVAGCAPPARRQTRSSPARSRMTRRRRSRRLPRLKTSRAKRLPMPLRRQRPMRPRRLKPTSPIAARLPERLPRRPDSRPAPFGNERALMLRLQTRREALDKLQKEIELREGLLAAAEKRLEDRIKDLRGAEDDEGIDPAIPVIEEAAAGRRADEDVVSMYETMRPKEAPGLRNT